VLFRSLLRHLEFKTLMNFEPYYQVCDGGRRRDSITKGHFASNILEVILGSQPPQYIVCSVLSNDPPWSRLKVEGSKILRSQYEASKITFFAFIYPFDRHVPEKEALKSRLESFYLSELKRVAMDFQGIAPYLQPHPQYTAPVSSVKVEIWDPEVIDSLEQQYDLK